MKVLILIIVSFIIYFIGEVNGRTVDELEKILASQFVEAFDRIIKIEKESAKEIKELKSKDLNNTNKIDFLTQQVEDLKESALEIKELKSKYLNNTNKIDLLTQQVENLKKDNAQEKEIRIQNEKQIELLKEQVEDLRKTTAPETCATIVKQGVTRGKDILLDSDGLNHGKKQLLSLTLFLLNFLM